MAKKKKARPAKGGRVTPKGTRPAGTAGGAPGDSGDGPRFTVRHARRGAAGGQGAVTDRKPVGARPAGRGQR